MREKKWLYILVILLCFAVPITHYKYREYSKEESVYEGYKQDYNLYLDHMVNYLNSILYQMENEDYDKDKLKRELLTENIFLFQTSYISKLLILVKNSFEPRADLLEIPQRLGAYSDRIVHLVTEMDTMEKQDYITELTKIKNDLSIILEVELFEEYRFYNTYDEVKKKWNSLSGSLGAAIK